MTKVGSHSTFSEMEKRQLPDTIAGNTITLKRHRIKLARTMFEYISRDRERLSRFLPWVEFTNSVTDSEDYIKSCDARWSDCSFFDYGIFRTHDEIYMGNIGVLDISWANNKCELGYWILGTFEGHGYISQAIRTLEETLFGLGFHRIEIQLDPRNSRSAAVPKKNGYKFEGIRRHAAFESGEYRDMAMYSKLAHECSN